MSTIIPVNVPLQISGQDQQIQLDVGVSQDITLGMDTAVRASINERYDGPYTVTPAGQAQTFATAGKLMTEDITVNAIPGQYGLVTWNGSTLTVS